MFLRTRTLAPLVVVLFALMPLMGQHAQATVTPGCYDPSTFAVRTATKFLASPGTLVGTNGPDVLVGSSGNDVIKGLGGDDLICGGQGDDHSDGGSGNDQINDFEGSTNTAEGGSGNDFITAFNGSFLPGFTGNANGGTGSDKIRVLKGIAHGNAGNDLVFADTGEAYGDAGDDQVDAQGVSLGDGGSGNDSLQGFQPGFTIRGGSGKDDLAVFSTQGILIDGGIGPFGHVSELTRSNDQLRDHPLVGTGALAVRIWRKQKFLPAFEASGEVSGSLIDDPLTSCVSGDNGAASLLHQTHCYDLGKSTWVDENQISGRGPQ